MYKAASRRSFTKYMVSLPKNLAISLFLCALAACSGGADGLVRHGSNNETNTDAFGGLPNHPSGLADVQSSGSHIDSVRSQDASRGHVFLDLENGPAAAPTNHPCQTSLTPGSVHEECTLLVCAKDNFCCDSYWDSVCVKYATDLCGISCACDDITTDFLACDTNDDRSFCGGNMCTGSWGCTGGACTPREDIVCDASVNNGCIQNLCNPKTGQCSIEINDQVCADDNPCTKDQCLASNGYCQHEEMALCMKNSPCKEAASPGSNNATVSDCVCAIHPDCCSDKWSWWCTYVAKSDCDAQCDCNQMPSSDLVCMNDSDCTFCGPDADICTGHWKCTNNQCVKEAGLVCNPSNDINCFINTCDPDLGGCTMKAHDDLCDDGLSCTKDFCTIDVEATGKANVDCVYQTIENCTETNNGSCIDRCGSYEAGANCQCDENCASFDDCCSDKCAICTSQPECD